LDRFKIDPYDPGSILQGSSPSLVYMLRVHVDNRIAVLVSAGDKFIAKNKLLRRKD
jgi:hypothetical protein